MSTYKFLNYFVLSLKDCRMVIQTSVLNFSFLCNNDLIDKFFENVDVGTLFKI